MPRVFRPGDVADERRGEGQVGGRCLRLVRTIFDARNSPPEVRLVLGEVVTLPGGWSSYPPHHHPQPEIYHYRFTHPQGFGHAEHGDDVFKVRQYDTIRIRAGNDHAQVAAPGYGMYYAWVIRHLPGKPYDGAGVHAGARVDDGARREDLGAAAASRRGRQAARVSPSDAQRRLHLPRPRRGRSLRPRARRAPRGRAALREVPRRLVRQCRRRAVAPRPQGRDADPRRRRAHGPLRARGAGREGVDVSAVRTDPRRLTGLVLLGIESAESFPHIFFRENCADMGLEAGRRRRGAVRRREGARDHRHAPVHRIGARGVAARHRAREAARPRASCSTSITGPCSGASPATAAAPTASRLGRGDAAAPGLPARLRPRRRHRRGDPRRRRRRERGRGPAGDPRAHRRDHRHEARRRRLRRVRRSDPGKRRPGPRRRRDSRSRC